MAKCLYFALYIACLILLSSCTPLHKKDGPPHFYVDESKIPNAVPKREPLSQYGNMRSYRVFGKRYHVLLSSKNYEAIGVASWYGTKFHAQRTSSGERYNMLAMTAAHKTLPLPTYVEVTNLRNKRKIIVKVNDRGPFRSNRLIDLSYVAAKKLGMLAHGTAMVKIKAIDPGRHNSFYDQLLRWVRNHKRTSRHLASSHPPIARPIFLRVGLFHRRAHAQHLQKRLSLLLRHTAIRITPLANKTLYRVEVGPFHDMTSANRATQHLRTLGLPINKAYG
jgi:rare lipoprotein A